MATTQSMPHSTAPPPSQAEPVSSKSDLNEPADLHIPDNYVSYTLKNTKALPPITRKDWYQNINYLSLTILTVTPLLALIGLFTIPIQAKTFWFSIFYYYITGLGITAGYHRLWAHRSYNASRPLEYFLAMAGAGAVEGSIHWWARGHRAHHRYTDTDLDPYGAHHGLLWSHIGWMIVKSRRKPGVADISDLRRNPVVKWQHRHYVPLILGMGFGLPTILPGLLWGDWLGGFFFAGAARLTFVHHSTFCVNSLAHWLGDTPFDDKHTPRDHIFTALVTIGEGYHNFHHQFPMDFRNAIKWYQYDPTKWFISTMQWLGLASHLKKFPDNEIHKGVLTMQLKKLRQVQDNLSWPADSNDLPVISWESFQEQAQSRPLILISGFIHDVSGFMDEHPGGRHLLAKNIGKDASTAFFGGVYDHSNAAHNLLAMKRVGILSGGTQLALDAEQYKRSIPPSQKLRVYRAEEMGSPWSSAVSDRESDHGILS